MEKSLGIQLTFIFNHKYIHYIIFEHLSILKFFFEKKIKFKFKFMCEDFNCKFVHIYF